ncbi:MAG: DUF2480 family protein [Chitinophagales bacterium]|nr:DUF2480 family protein [Chitinophagales bacterium]MCZ2393869.1 DUF2480 family protein [Chitinophagales bacterium]
MSIENKVTQSGIIILDLEDLHPKNEIVELDISQFLYKGLVLREKEFRAHLKDWDWEQFHNQIVAVYCSTNAIVAQWAYMLIANYLIQKNIPFHFGTKSEVFELVLNQAIQGIAIDNYLDKIVVVKGCGAVPSPDAAYLEVTKKLLPIVKSLMFGEPCSTVPIYKKRR